MDVFHAPHASMHFSWERDSSKTLLITSEALCVHLLHIDPAFHEVEASLISLSGDEAMAIASRIRRVLAGEKGVNPESDPEQSRLVVHYTNDGEPFREGVALDLDTGSYQRDFTFSMDDHTARAVAVSLEKAAAVLSVSVKESEA